MISLRPRTIVIIGAGPLMSRSLSLYLASHNWQIILISRNHSSLLSLASEINDLNPKAPKVLVHAGDASIPSSLHKALDWAVEQLGGKVDVLCYNAAHVAPSPILELKPEALTQDFNITALGTLVAGYVCFLHHQSKSRIQETLITTPQTMVHAQRQHLPYFSRRTPSFPRPRWPTRQIPRSEYLRSLRHQKRKSMSC